MSDLSNQLTPLRFMERTAFAFPYRVGVIDGPRRISWAVARHHVTRLAHAIQAAGIGAGDHVVYVASNSAELVLAYYGVPLSGAVLVVADVGLGAEEIARILTETGARMVMAEAEVAEELADVLADVEVVVLPDRSGNTPTGSRGKPYADFLAEGSDEPLSWSVTDESRTVAISYTAGAGGRARSLRHTHRQAYLDALDSSQREDLDPRTRYLWTRPMSHCHESGSVWAVTAAGGTHICARTGGAELWRLVDRERVTHTVGTPRFHTGGRPAYAAVN